MGAEVRIGDAPLGTPALPEELVIRQRIQRPAARGALWVRQLSVGRVHDQVPCAVHAQARYRSRARSAVGSSPAGLRAATFGDSDRLRQVFINLADNKAIDRQPDDFENKTGFAVFGHVVTGMDVVDAIAALPLGGPGPFPGAAPLTPVVIQKASVLK